MYTDRLPRQSIITREFLGELFRVLPLVAES